MSRFVMIGASLFNAVIGLFATFAPDEILRYLDASSSLTPFVQILGALYLGFAMLDWMAKDTSIGGIYGRPIITGNLVHFVVAGLALLKNGSMLPLTVVYLAFAIAFGYLMFRRSA